MEKGTCAARQTSGLAAFRLLDRAPESATEALERVQNGLGVHAG